MHSDSSPLETIQTIVDSHKTMPGALLPILHAIQHSVGCIPDAAVAVIASALSLSRAEVHGVISFYPHFRTQPAGRHVLEICRAESCQAMGGQRIEAHAKQLLGIDWHETTPDGAITLEPVYCLGNCACSPSLRAGDDIHGRVSCESLADLVAELRSAP